MARNRKRNLLLTVLGGSAGIVYLFRDEFTTDLAAGSVNGTAAEPGPGTRAVTDTGNALSLSSGEMVISGSRVSNADPAYRNGTFQRAAGRAFMTRAKWGGNFSGVGFSGTTSFALTEAALYYDGALYVRPDNVNLTLATNTYTRLAIVLQTAGALFFKDETLEWVSFNGSTATLYVVAGSAAGTPNHTYDYWALRDLSGPFATDNGIATLNVASPTDATEYVGDADGFIDLTVTAPGSLDGSATTRCGFYYRADSDLSPAWHAYVDGTGAFNLDSIDAGGSRTNRIAVAGVIAGGATRTLRILANGTKHNAWTLSGTTWTKRGSEINVSLNNTVTTIEPSIPAGWTAANLRSWPRTSTLYETLDPN